MSIFRIPTSQDGVLPCTLTAVSEQQKAIDAAKSDATRTQKVLVRLTASVGVVFAGALDAIIHTALLVVKTIPVIVKATVAKWVGLDKYMSAAFDGSELVGHGKKIGASIVMVVKGFVFGAYDPNIVINTGYAWTLFNPKPPKPDGQGSGSPAAGVPASGVQVVPPAGAVDTLKPATAAASDAKVAPVGKA